MIFLLRTFNSLEKIFCTLLLFCYFLDKDWKFYGIISFIGIFSIIILSGIVYVCVKCIKLIKLKHRQVRNNREMERNPQAFQLRLLPESVQNFSSFN